MKLDAIVLGCLRGIGGASLVLAAGCASSPPPAEQQTTPIAVVQPTPIPARPMAQPATQPGTEPGTEPVVETDPDIMSACGRG